MSQIAGRKAADNQGLENKVKYTEIVQNHLKEKGSNSSHTCSNHGD
jgi:hypothetical protein